MTKKKVPVFKFCIGYPRPHAEGRNSLALKGSDYCKACGHERRMDVLYGPAKRRRGRPSTKPRNGPVILKLEGWAAALKIFGRMTKEVT